MDVDRSNNGSYTILRIKRKRNEEPLDALVVESKVRRKKTKPNMGVFQYAQTVEQDTWDDEQRRKALEEEISKLARANALKSPAEAVAPVVAPTEQPPSPASNRKSRDEAALRRYAIIEHEGSENTRRRPLTSPPKVISHKDLLDKSVSDFKLFDAVYSNEPMPPLVSDPQMEHFLPLLKEYLKIDDSPFSTPSPSLDAAAFGTAAADQKYSDSSDDYVWDVFYHRPMAGKEYSDVANVGTLTGLPASVVDPLDSDSDSEVEDEADEDSNAEEYYKNDYPDEESEDSDSDGGGSDAFHEDSDYEEALRDF